MQKHFEEYNYNPEKIKESRILTRTKTEISSDKEPTFIYYKGKEISPHRVRAIDSFNEFGYLILSVVPKYEMREADTTGFGKLSSWEQLLFRKEVESNLPDGWSEKTFFYYDNKNRIITKEEKIQGPFGESYENSKVSYEYDDNNNLTKSCDLDDYSKTFCFSSTYKYNNSKKTISEIIEYPEEAVSHGWPEQSEVNYTYDTNGKLTSKGNIHFVYDNEKLIEKYEIERDTKTKIFKYKYDNNGNCIKEILFWTSATENNERKFKVLKYDTITIYRIFNEKQLITDWYSKISAKEHPLYKYQYKTKL
ncbi:hypothetical protein [Yeosuana sp. AK3]